MSELIIYRDIPHTYHGVDTGVEYLPVSSVFKMFQKKTDWDSILKAISKRDGIPIEDIQAEWDRKRISGTEAGTLVHLKREHSLLDSFVIELNGEEYFPVRYKTEGDKKFQIKELSAGACYPELIVSHPYLNIAGTSDEVYITKDWVVHIQDTKTDKSIEYEGYKGATLINGLEHRPDCNYSAYAIKCSMYMYLLTTTYPTLTPGTIRLRHTPIERDETGCAVVSDDVVELSETYIDIDYNEYKLDVEIILNYYEKKFGRLPIR